jgi:hypothetical protein
MREILAMLVAQCSSQSQLFMNICGLSNMEVTISVAVVAARSSIQIVDCRSI